MDEFEKAKMPSSPLFSSQNLIWMDLEMTGLDVNKDTVLEIACIVTDINLNIVAEGPDIIIHQPDDILKNMNQWCINQHFETGLTEASRKSTTTMEKAEQKILDFVKQYAPEKRCPLAGNSVYMDRLFLKKYFPTLDEYIHYRIVDVSSIKELCRRWYPKVYKNAPPKAFEHRSLADIKESIDELKYYRSQIFLQQQ